MMAMRGHASIQGSTDIPTLYNLLPGYLLQPTKGKQHETLKEYLESERVDKGYWANMPKFMVSLLKAWYGDAATPENDTGSAGSHASRATTRNLHIHQMAKGKVKGLFLMGQNPAVGAPNALLNRKALTKLDWLVVRDFFLLESATFWKEGPENPDPDHWHRGLFPPSSSQGRKSPVPSLTPSGCSNGTTKLSTRPAIAALIYGSCTTWAAASKSYIKGAPTA